MDKTYHDFMTETHKAHARNDSEKMAENFSILNTMVHILALKGGAANLDATIHAALQQAIEIQENFKAKYGHSAEKAAA